MTPSLRRLAAATALSTALLTVPPSMAAPPDGLVVRGSHTASVEVTLTEDWTMPGDLTGTGHPHAVKLAGSYAGVMIERPPRLPALGAEPVFGIVFARDLYRPDWMGGGLAPVRFGGYGFTGGTIPPGRYRITLFADGPSEVVLRGDGAPRKVYRPRDEVEATVRMSRFTPVPEAPGGLRVAELVDLPTRPRTNTVLAIYSHVHGTRNELTFCLRANGETTKACAPGDRCFGDFRSGGDNAAKRYIRLITIRAGESRVGEYSVYAPVDSVSLAVAPVHNCGTPEGRYDWVATESVSTPITDPSSVSFALHVDPRPFYPVEVDGLGRP